MKFCPVKHNANMLAHNEKMLENVNAKIMSDINEAEFSMLCFQKALIVKEIEGLKNVI